MAEEKRLFAEFSLENGLAAGEGLPFDDPLKLAGYFEDAGADGLIITDLSEDDEGHDEHIGIMRQIDSAYDIPFIAKGHVRRAEDVKKYLYAGACMVCLDDNISSNKEMRKEVSERFGYERICLLKSDGDIEINTARGEKGIIAAAAGCSDIESMFASLDVCGAAFTGPVPFSDIKADLKAKGFKVSILESSVNWSEVKPDENGLLPVIVQDHRTGEVLMQAYMNEQAFNDTVRTGKMNYYSRSRKGQWLKGETSGHFQYVRSLCLDCDNDTLLAKVSQVGPACHTGSRSCFFRNICEKNDSAVNPLTILEDVYGVIADRKENPKEGSYTNYLFDKGLDKILKKIGEENAEVIIASKNPGSEELIYELSDLLYHAMVLMVEKGISWDDLTKELANRA